MRRLVLIALVAGAAATFATPAGADVCAGATVTIPEPPIVVGPVCVVTPGDTQCSTITGPGVEVTLCRPLA